MKEAKGKGETATDVVVRDGLLPASAVACGNWTMREAPVGEKRQTRPFVGKEREREREKRAESLCEK